MKIHTPIVIELSQHRQLYLTYDFNNRIFIKLDSEFYDITHFIKLCNDMKKINIL